MEIPHNWVVVKINNEGETYFKVLAGWSGGYLDGNSWMMNSGIVSVEEDDESFLFHGQSGSIYKCYKQCYGLRMNNAHVWEKLRITYPDKVELMDEHTDWMNIQWSLVS